MKCSSLLYDFVFSLSVHMKLIQFRRACIRVRTCEHRNGERVNKNFLASCRIIHALIATYCCGAGWGSANIKRERLFTRRRNPNDTDVLASSTFHMQDADIFNEPNGRPVRNNCRMAVYSSRYRWLWLVSGVRKLNVAQIVRGWNRYRCEQTIANCPSGAQHIRIA